LPLTQVAPKIGQSMHAVPKKPHSISPPVSLHAPRLSQHPIAHVALLHDPPAPLELLLVVPPLLPLTAPPLEDDPDEDDAAPSSEDAPCPTASGPVEASDLSTISTLPPQARQWSTGHRASPARIRSERGGILAHELYHLPDR
jgi:hypothetical protein